MPSDKLHIIKISTRDKLAKRDIRKLYEVSGEVDIVKPSPRSEQQKAVAADALKKTTSNKNEIRLTQEQLMALINAIKTSSFGSGAAGADSSKSNSLENLNLNLNFSGEETTTTSNNKAASNATPFESKSSGAINGVDMAKKLLMEKKKQKWMNDKDLLEKLKLQEEYDNQKFLSAHQDRTDEDIARNSNRTQSSMNGLHGSGQNVPFHKSTMTLAEKKRIQWQLEKEDQVKIENEIKKRNAKLLTGTTLPPVKIPTPRVDDDLLVYTLTTDKNNIINAVKLPSRCKNNQEDISKFFISSTNDLTKINRSAPGENDSVLRKSNSLNNLSELEKLEINQNQLNRNVLMEKKKQQWVQDKENAEQWIFGGKSEKSSPKKPEQEESNMINGQKESQTSKKPPPVPKDYKDALEEYNKIKSAIDAITKAEDKIKQDKYEEELAMHKQKDEPSLNNSDLPSPTDQSRVPAAMRTSIMFGNVKYDEDIKRAQEFEKRKWLKELEEQKRQKFLENQQQQQQQSFNAYSQKSKVLLT